MLVLDRSLIDTAGLAPSDLQSRKISVFWGERFQYQYDLVTGGYSNESSWGYRRKDKVFFKRISRKDKEF